MAQSPVRRVALVVAGALASFDLSVMGQAVAKPEAQHPPVNQVRPQPREVEVEAPPPIGEPLRPDLKELPAAYAADSIPAVADGLRPAEKGEFETTAQYNARVAALRPTRTYSFWMNGQISRRYDADRQVLKIQVPVSSCTYFGPGPNCNVSSLIVTTFDGRSGYLGTNAFGVAREVTSVARQNYGVILRQFKGFSMDFELSMPPDEAKEVEDVIDVLITVSPDPAQNTQYLVDGFTSSSATISAPVDTREGYTYLTMPLTSVWLASRVSGRIFGKFVPTAR